MRIRSIVQTREDTSIGGGHGRLAGRGIAITGGAGDIGAAMGAELRRFSTMG